jgi:hypothetical protein
MQIKVKKKGKTKKYKLIESWEDVTLEQWVRLGELADGKKTTEALETINALSDLPKKIINELSIRDVAIIMERIAELQQNEHVNLKNIVTIEDKDYGFHPNLEDITLGEYADIEHFLADGVEKNLAEIMAVLYRPIIERKNDAYIIEAYDGKIDVRAEVFKKMSAEQVQGALVFFWGFVKELSVILPLYLMERMNKMNKMTQSSSQKALQKNGDGSV